VKDILELLPVRRIQAYRQFLVPKAYRILEFLTSQGIALAARLTYGFLCVRLLPVTEYAKFAVVFGFLGFLSVLMDFFSGTLLPLVGERINDRQLIADYVASLRQLAHRVYLLAAPAAIVVYPLVVRKQQWSWRVIAAMVLLLLVASWFGRMGGTYGSALIALRNRRAWYQAQLISGVGSLAALGVVWAVHALNAFSAILISVAAIAFLSLHYCFRARETLGVRGHPSVEKRRAIIHLALPVAPNVIFYALQGQLSLFLITFFGHSAAVASVGALSRLAQIFMLFGQMAPLLIEPYFAKLPQSRVKRNYLGMLAAQGTLCICATSLARYFPQIFLWILGPKYGALRQEVVLMIAGSSIAYLSAVLFMIHTARRFVYWWNSVLVIIFTVTAQALFIIKTDLSTVRGVLVLNLVTAAVGLFVHVFTGIYGLVRGPRSHATGELVSVEDSYV